jgi:hypothetical protein
LKRISRSSRKEGIRKKDEKEARRKQIIERRQ